MIAHFPNQHFYQGRIENRANLAVDRSARWHSVPALGAYRFFNHHQLEEEAPHRPGYSSCGEAELAIELYRALERVVGKTELAGQVAIITPYVAQRELLSRLLAAQNVDIV